MKLRSLFLRNLTLISLSILCVASAEHRRGIAPHGITDVRPMPVRQKQWVITRGGVTDRVLPSQSLSKNRTRLDNLKERTIPAVLLLTVLAAVVEYGREIGLQYLVLLLTPQLYHECTSVAFDKDIQPPSRFTKWSWFIAYSTCITIPLVVPSHWALLTQLVGGLLVILNFARTIVSLNGNTESSHVVGGGKGGSALGSHVLPFDLRKAWSHIGVAHTSLLMTLVPAACWILTLQDFGQVPVLYTALLIIINDTMAYIFGVFFGKHALLPTISPKKTWEGFVGAALSTTALALPLARYMNVKQGQQSDVVFAMAMAAVTSILSPFGGFLASAYKRGYGVKDFSNILPGHGGFVDRLDCQLFTAPLLYLYLRSIV